MSYSLSRIFVNAAKRGSFSHGEINFLLKRRLRQIGKMTPAERIRRMNRNTKLVVAYILKEDNARCWHEEMKLMARLLGLPWIAMGKMNLPKNILQRNCNRYIDRQQCERNGCTKSYKAIPHVSDETRAFFKKQDKARGRHMIFGK
ncbi:MAG: hypothetical protein K0S38_337 [Candidatus Paceibacter sp.]|jgi:hypothetical protein|nr:hypothetical protein [Candidatus Paceibacter sp.]